MPVPKRKRSKARRDKRFANKGLKPAAITHCASCTTPLATHVACGECGFYKGRKVLTTKAERGVKRAENVKKMKQEEPAQAAE